MSGEPHFSINENDPLPESMIKDYYPMLKPADYAEMRVWTIRTIRDRSEGKYIIIRTS